MLVPRLVRTCLIALLMVAATLVTPTTAQAGLSKKEAERRVVVWHNKARVKRDRAKIRQVRCLKRFARAQAKRQANLQRMFHQRLGPVMKRCDLRMAGENVAMGYVKPAAVHRAWMRSKGHRANILRPGYRLVGVGRARADNGDLYWAVVFGRR